MIKRLDICYSDESSAQKLDLYLPDGDGFATFVYFHGGGLEKGDKNRTADIGEYLTGRGIGFATVNYRMYPDAKYPDFICDCAKAVAWVINNIGSFGGAADKVFAGGSSAGGYISMMLCFDEKYLGACGVSVSQLAGFVHDAGQPTKHFNVLREMGEDTRRIVVDDAAPLYHIGRAESYPPMHFIVSDNDMENRYEQTMLTLSTLKHFRYDASKISLGVMNGTHCAYCNRVDENGVHIFGSIIADFVNKYLY